MEVDATQALSDFTDDDDSGDETGDEAASQEQQNRPASIVIKATKYTFTIVYRPQIFF